MLHMYEALECDTTLHFHSLSALSQDEQEDAQLRIEDILQMVRKLQHIKS